MAPIALVSLLFAFSASDGRGEEGAASSSAPAGDAETSDKSLPQLRGRIADETGAPVTDAEVTLTGRGSGSGVRNYYQTETDDDGRYAFESIETADVFRLRVESTRWVGITDWRNAPQLHLSPTSSVVRDMKLSRACVMLLRVVDTEGRPIRNANVYARNLAADRYAPSPRVSTDELGMAEIGGLKPSTTKYRFGVTSSAHAFGMVEQVMPKAGWIGVATLAMEEGIDVRGVALCSDGKPAAGWRIRALPDWWDYNAYPRGVEIGANGGFTLTHITPGKYDLSISVPTGERMSMSVPVASGRTLPPEEGLLRVSVDSPSPQGMGTISGTLTLSGREATQGISITALSEGDRRHNSHEHVGPGDTDFTIGPLPPGKYRLDIDSPEVERVTLRNVRVPTQGLEIPVEVRGKPRLNGRVVNSDGSPLEEFRVRVAKIRSLRGPNYVQESEWIAVNDPAGEFSVDVVGPGIYRVTAVADGYAPTTSESLNTDDPPGEPVTLKLGGGVTLRGSVVDERGQPVDGAIVAPRSASSEVLPHLAKRFAGDEGAATTVGGAFELARLPAGKELLRVTHPDYLFALSDEVTLVGEEVDLPPITLRRGATVSGTVYDSQGDPRPGVLIRFDDRQGYGGFRDKEVGTLASAVTDESGRYVARRLPDRLCYVHLDEEWGFDGVVRTAIKPAYGEERILDFGGPGGFEGSLLINGEPATDVLLELGGENQHVGVFKAFARTDGEGWFSFGRPPAGRRVLWLQKAGQRNQWLRVAEVDFPASAEPGATIDLGDLEYGGAAVSVSVSGLKPEERETARVMLKSHDPGGLTFGRILGNPVALTPSDDAVVFQDVPAGKVDASVLLRVGVSLRTTIDVPENATAHEAEIAWPAETGALEVNLAKEFGADGARRLPMLREVDGRVFAGLRPPSGGGPVRIERLPVGEYFLTDQYTDEPRRLVEFAITADETTEIDLSEATFGSAAKDSAMVRIRWFGPGGVPLAGVTGDVRDASGKETLRVMRSDAEWTCVGGPGDYVARGEFPGYAPIEAPVTITASESEGVIANGPTVDLVMGVKR